MRIASKTITIFLTVACILSLTVSAKSSTIPDNVNREQLEAQISFFNSALNEFGASSPEQAINLWIKGDATRNGVFKYSVACNFLKQQLINRWGKPEQSFWIIGGSSPWLTGSEIIYKENISQAEIKYRVRYYWATSAGPEKPSVEDLLVVRDKENWCIKSAVQIEGYPNY